jgi:hypothetical protein
MVLGIGDGEINITLSKSNIKPGEIVKGKVTITLKKPHLARDLSIDVYSETDEEGYSLKENRRYVLRQLIAGEKIYKDGDTYAFTFTIPKGLETKKSVHTHALGFEQHTGERAAIWFVQASLNVPLAFDITHRIGVKVLKSAP